jgi:thiol-disulfide isomerase/thioredoxin/DNA-directed RNA polymerase subunit F
MVVLKKIILFFICIASTAYAQNQSVAKLTGGKIHIQGQIVGAENQEIKIVNQNIGGAEKPYYVAETDEKGEFSIDTIIPVADYYFLQIENGQYISLVLKPEDSLKIYSDAKNFVLFTNIIGSEDSEQMNEFIAEFANFKSKQDSLIKILRVNPNKQEEINAWFEPRARNFSTYRTNFMSKNQNSPALIATLGSLNENKEWEVYKQVVGLLQNSFGESPTVKNMAVFVAQQDAKIKQQEQQAAAKAERFKPGTPAKEIALPGVDGEIIKLSDLQGKIVLIDFWASWCGPCRRENPNVVKLYKKYKDAGFEVYSVSLDQQKNGQDLAAAKVKWTDAIKKDGLIWPSHVSDLRGWGSQAAQDYGVNSIPFTLLIDKEGNIIKSNLRGVALEEELARIFGF